MRSRSFRGNVFVANLPPEFTDDELAETFDSFGMVLRASIAAIRQTANGCVTALSISRPSARPTAAVAAMNGNKIHGYTLDVRISERPATGKKPARVTSAPWRGSIRLDPASGWRG